MEGILLFTSVLLLRGFKFLVSTFARAFSFIWFILVLEDLASRIMYGGQTVLFLWNMICLEDAIPFHHSQSSFYPQGLHLSVQRQFRGNSNLIYPNHLPPIFIKKGFGLVIFLCYPHIGSRRFLPIMAGRGKFDDAFALTYGSITLIGGLIGYFKANSFASYIR